MSIGSNIRTLRKSLNMAQSKLAEKTGISEISIRKYENDARNPKIENLLKIAEALNVTINELNHSDSLTYLLIQNIVSIIEDNPLTIINDKTDISIEKLKYILENPYKDLSIVEQQDLLSFLYSLDESTCKKFCQDNCFYGDLTITEFMLDLTKPKNLKYKSNPVSGQYSFNRDAFYRIIQSRISDISKHYGMNIGDNEVKNIINQIDTIIFNELFKKYNKEPRFYDKFYN
jgi:transcriptional regulator with XRE-family HTH domain